MSQPNTLICYVLLLIVTSLANGQSLILLNTEPRIQLTGEDFQITSNGIYFTDTVPGRSLSQAGVLGVDLGFPVKYRDKILLLFGDTLGGWFNNGRFYLSGAGQGHDSIGYIPDTDLSQCHYIATVAAEIAAGNSRPSVSPSACPAIQFYLNPRPAQNEHAFQRILINGLEPGDDRGLGGFMTPSGGIVFNDRLYMFYKVQIQETPDRDCPARNCPHLALKTIMVRSDQVMSAWSQMNLPTFTRLYTVSFHPPVPNPASPPPETNDTGKFMFDPPLVMEQSTLVANAISPGLPQALQNAARVVFVFGSSFRYNRSNLYLAAFDLNDIERGTGSWFYYAGNSGGTNNWTSDERQAVPLVAGDPRIGNHTVMWNNTLHRFVLMYGNIVASASATPWGPWSDSVAAFPPNGQWATKLIHRSPTDSIKRTVTPIYLLGTNTQTDINTQEIGIPYGPNLLEQSTLNPDGSVTLYYTMSAWNPYEVFLTSSTFRIGPSRAPVVSAASFDGSVVAAGSIATIAGSGFSSSSEAAVTSQPLPEELGGVSVTVQDSQGISRKAKLYYVSPRQINFVVPDETAAGPSNINVMSGTSLIFAATADISAAAPSLFSANANGRGPAAAVVTTMESNGNKTTTLSFSCQSEPGSCAGTPIDVSTTPGQTVLELYGTGVRGRQGPQSVAATIGGVPVRVLFAGAQPQYPGLDQINLELSPQLRGRGRQELILLVDGRPANTVELNFR